MAGGLAALQVAMPDDSTGDLRAPAVVTWDSTRAQARNSAVFDLAGNQPKTTILHEAIDAPSAGKHAYIMGVAHPKLGPIAALRVTVGVRE